jgi:hypothetical protein
VLGFALLTLTYGLTACSCICFLVWGGDGDTNLCVGAPLGFAMLTPTYGLGSVEELAASRSVGRRSTL